MTKLKGGPGPTGEGGGGPVEVPEQLSILPLGPGCFVVVTGRPSGAGATHEGTGARWGCPFAARHGSHDASPRLRGEGVTIGWIAHPGQVRWRRSQP